jgi:hypothetical protein
VARWRGFERLAEKIIAELEPQATVKWNDFIRGHETETERQIDVSIRWKSEDEHYLTIVQAKDYSRPADINVVGEFLSVMQDVKASGGALVCRAGFTKSAHTYAKKRGIALYNLHDAASVNWSLKLTIPIVWSELTPVVQIGWRIALDVGESIPVDDPLGIPMTADEGRTRLNPMSTFERLWNSPDAQRGLGMVHNLVSDVPIKVAIQDIHGATVFRAAEFYFSYVVQRQSWLGEFQPSECRGLLDYLGDRAFLASYLPLSEVPIQRDEKWVEVDNPDELAVTIRGTVATTKQIMEISNPQVGTLGAHYVGPLAPSSPSP